MFTVKIKEILDKNIKIVVGGIIAQNRIQAMHNLPA